MAVQSVRPRARGSRVRPRRGIATAGAAVVLALLSACSSGGEAPAPAPGAAPASPGGAPARTLTVVASTNVWGDVAAKVAGPGVQVRSIIDDPNGDPHAYEGTPADAAAIGSADLVVYNGGGYDEFVSKALDANPASRSRTIEAFTLRPDQAEENEHVWFDPTTVTAVARQVAERLGRADPSQAAAFTDRANAFAGQVAQIGQSFAAIGAARPNQRGVSSEPVPFYLERAAGVSDATPEEFSEAIEEETDPPAGVVAQTNDLISSRGVNVLFFNPQTESPVTQNLRVVAQTASVPVVEVTETLPSGQDYLGWLDGYRTAIASAVGAPR